MPWRSQLTIHYYIISRRNTILPRNAVGKHGISYSIIRPVCPSCMGYKPYAFEHFAIVTLTFDRLTSKLVSEWHVIRATPFCRLWAFSQSFACRFKVRSHCMQSALRRVAASRGMLRHSDNGTQREATLGTAPQCKASDVNESSAVQAARERHTDGRSAACDGRRRRRDSG